MRHLDITIDFETCAMTANAAVMQVAMVPWLRDNDADPFCNEQEVKPFVGYVDLRTCVVDGFDFDQETVKWWAGRSDVAKRAVTSGEPKPMETVVYDIFTYIRDLVKSYSLDSLCLWCQGSDYDIAILRNLCRKYGIDMEAEIPHTSYRDCRTLILEAALRRSPKPETILADPSKAYNLYEALPERYARNSESHDALYDAMRSSWNTWQALKCLGLCLV